jgi:hypothetical protein
MLLEKNKRHHGTYALFADDRHICTYSYKENAEKAADDLTEHDRKNGRNTLYAVKEIAFLSSNRG